MSHAVTRYDVTLTLIGPLLTRSTTHQRLGIDMVTLRTAKGHPVLPGPHVLGKVREAWEQFASVEPNSRYAAALDLLGTPGFDATGAEVKDGAAGRRKRLIAYDFVATHAGDALGRRTRIKIAPEVGAADDGQLIVVDAPYDAGERVVFTGQLVLLGPEPAGLNLTLGLTKALQWASQMGGLKGIGFGQLADVAVTRAPLAMPSAAEQPTHSANRIGFRLTPQDAFCLSDRPEYGNIFHGQATISGAAIKGTIARMMQAGGLPDCDAAVLARLHISHAQPSPPPGPRPVAIPSSLVWARACGRLYDVALNDGRGGRIGASAERAEAPAFAADWKGAAWQQAQKLFGQYEPDTELRLRTEINSQTRRAETSRLFGYRSVLPQGFVWTGWITLSQLEHPQQRAQAETLLACLANIGLVGLGKTDARADLTFVAADAITPAIGPEPTVRAPDHSILCLQTPALLCPPNALEATQDNALFHAYAAYFGKVSGGAVALLRHFAHQRLHGGVFHRHRYQANRTHYQPWAVTQPGATFVLKHKDRDKAQDWLKQIGETGLRPNEDILAGYELDSFAADDLWKYCPWLPENGFGEVAINLQTHWWLQPRADYWHAVGECA
jgi:hypothetical protein